MCEVLGNHVQPDCSLGAAAWQKKTKHTRSKTPGSPVSPQIHACLSDILFTCVTLFDATEDVKVQTSDGYVT